MKVLVALAVVGALLVAEGVAMFNAAGGLIVLGVETVVGARQGMLMQAKNPDWWRT